MTVFCDYFCVCVCVCLIFMLRHCARTSELSTFLMRKKTFKDSITVRKKGGAVEEPSRILGSFFLLTHILGL